MENITAWYAKQSSFTTNADSITVTVTFLRNRISVEDENDSSDSTEEQDKSEYQQLWVTPSGQPSFDNPGADRLSLVSQVGSESL